MNVTITENEENDVSEYDGGFFDTKYEVLANQMRYVCRISREISSK